MAGITKKQIKNRKISEAMRKHRPEKIKKLEEAAAFDASIDEMCFYADITPQTYYNWTKEDPKLLERLDALRNHPTLAARQRVVKGINESYFNAMDYLKRKKKAEFSERQEFEHKITDMGTVLDEIEKENAESKRPKTKG